MRCKWKIKHWDLKFGWLASRRNNHHKLSPSNELFVSLWSGCEYAGFSAYSVKCDKLKATCSPRRWASRWEWSSGSWSMVAKLQMKLKHNIYRSIESFWGAYEIGSIPLCTQWIEWMVQTTSPRITYQISWKRLNKHLNIELGCLALLKAKAHTLKLNEELLTSLWKLLNFTVCSVKWVWWNKEGVDIKLSKLR